MRQCGRGEWQKFRRYHYLNEDLSDAAICYGLYDDEIIIGFCAVLHQPHRVKNLKRCSRIVILPDYQGIGLGTQFLNIIADYYKHKGYQFSIVTSAKNMVYALMRSNKWTLIRYSSSRPSNNKNAIDYKRDTLRTQCKTASFFYK